MTRELKRLYLAWGYSLDGIGAAWRDAGAFRSEVILTIPIVALAFYFAENETQLALLLASWFFVIVVELLNTGIEAVTDLAADGRILDHAKKAKDTASAAVLVSAIIFVITWAVILIK